MCNTKLSVDFTIISSWKDDQNLHITHMRLKQFVRCSFHRGLPLLHARCADQPLTGIWVGEHKSVGQPTFSPIFLLNCSHGLSAPVCFLGLAWPLPSFGCPPTCSVWAHRFCPDLPILEPTLNRGQQHLSAHLPQGVVATHQQQAGRLTCSE